ncbi:Bug family tripartite tricarboxylate transporter substrate binding protein [Salisediminibacterium beveridgei]|uniref:Tripartite-type tricarboxylate transporter, receptor component TctC n=1 Tax=Salisediminibacterium beveridgei TaxID=632773 RepID=A0A1D7QYY1_9BACI|nr:tripartite tricarboxylate transporter substrate-binding protein [Salisediminibacterium beveridgei]AOM84217.1 hypothetical protein BBEV_2892 [Salisediminibacterium beveridgei]
MKQLMVVLLLGIVLAGCSGEETAERESYPTAPVTIIVPYSEGGSSDIMARLTAEALSDYWGMDVTVDNRDGESAVLGMQDIADAEPDGYTFGMFGSPDEQVLSEREDLSFMQDDFDFLMGFDREPHALMSAPSFSGENLERFKDAAGEQPGRITVGHSGPLGELLILLLEEQLDVDVTPVIYDGGGDLLLALQQDEIDAASTSLSTKDRVNEAGGSLMGYGSEDLGDGLSFSEQGHEIHLKVMRTLVAPVGIPDDHREEMITALEAVVQTDEWHENIEEAGIDFSASDEDEVQQFLEEMSDIVDERIQDIQVSP